MPRLCFTVDYDRDVNLEIPGQIAAGSLDRGEGTSPRFTSSGRGLRLLVEALDDAGMPATFFCEGRTLEENRDTAGLLDGFDIGAHGYDHEALAHMIRPDAIAAVEHGCQVIKDITGRPPSCFRAPYMHRPKNIADFLRNTGIRIDSSTYASGDECRETSLPGYVAEVPVTRGSTVDGRKVTSYLWPLHEGKRSPKSYEELGESVPDDGVYVIADHTWHVCETRFGGIQSDAESKASAEQAVGILVTLADAGFEPVTVSEASVHAFEPSARSDGL